MGDGDSRIDVHGRAERTRMLAGDGAGVGEEQVAPKGPSRKEVTQAAFDKGIENLTYSLTAPIPLQIWHSAKGAVDAVRPKEPEAPAAAVTGVRLYPLVEKELPKTARSGEAVHAGPYSLHPQMARSADGKESVAYYTAVRHGRAEFAVGTDSVEMFKAHTNIYEQQADYDWGITTARPYEKDVYRTGEAISNQDYKGAVLHGWHSWEHAFGDPTWAAQRVVDVAAITAVPEGPGMRTTPVAAGLEDHMAGDSSVGAMKRYTYEASPKHGTTKVGNVSAAPKNGQVALDNSVQVKEGPRRVGVDYDTGEVVVFDQTHPNKGIFHGHVRAWDELTSVQQNELIRAGYADRRGRILGGEQ